MLQTLGVTLPIGATLALADAAHGFSREEMPADLAKLYRGRCAADPLHARTLEVAVARLDAAGIKYDRADLAATLRCPICGCNILSGGAAFDGSRQARLPSEAPCNHRQNRLRGARFGVNR